MIPGTIFLDIDGVLFTHHGNLLNQVLLEPTLLPGVTEKLVQWTKEGHTIILTTGRPESYREQTVRQLALFAIPYSQLIMGLPRGTRTVINDFKLTSEESLNKMNVCAEHGEKYHLEPTAKAFCLLRNEGLLNLDINKE